MKIRVNSFFHACAVSVTWNGTAVTGPVLIYHDEVLENYHTLFDSPGHRVLVCRSATQQCDYKSVGESTVQLRAGASYLRGIRS